MALPEKVINELSEGKTITSGWSWRIFLFSIFVLVVVVAFYLGLNFGFKTYLNNQIKDFDNQINQLDKSFSDISKEQLLAFYSQLVNVKKIFSSRKSIAPIFGWIENKTHKDVIFTKLNVNTLGNQISLSGVSKTKNSSLEQVLLLQKADGVSNVVLKNLASSGDKNTWQFDMDIYLESSFWNLIK